MSDIAILKEMIKESATVPLEEHKGKKQVILKEPPPADYSVTIDGMPDDAQVIVIKADAFPAPNKIFTSSKGQCKRADFVIVADTPTEKIIFCIEMKKNKDQNKNIIQQLTGAKCFVDYCQEIGKAFWNQQNFLEAYEYRFVSIGHISISKGKTRNSRSTETNDRLTEIHDRPDRMLKISRPNKLQFNHLIYGR
ncbi:MAG: hypothetical protein JGK23_31010, partial [Microcoleus sp. PH2017_19_SFW_U_A]|nr:hypothetical protein [Microcoleus sp. PH2017_19_SFW_U_A]